MKARAPWVLAVAALGMAAAMLHAHVRDVSVPVDGAAPAADATGAEHTAPNVPPPPPSNGAAGAPSAAPRVPAPLLSAQRNAPASMKPDQVLLRVDGVPIRGRDLLAFGPSESDKSVTPEMYAFLLQRAVERQLTVAAARAQGIELTDAQKAQLQVVRAQASARGGTAPGPRDPAEIELEVAAAEAELLQGELLARAGTPRPGPTEEDVKRDLEARRDELEPLPADEPARAEAIRRRELEARARLAGEQQTRWAHARDELLARLSASASIGEEPR